MQERCRSIEERLRKAAIGSDDSPSAGPGDDQEAEEAATVFGDRDRSLVEVLFGRRSIGLRGIEMRVARQEIGRGVVACDGRVPFVECEQAVIRTSPTIPDTREELS